jgi:hypothetical protein
VNIPEQWHNKGHSNLRLLLMAMRPEVRRRAIVIIVFSFVQWLFMRYILANDLWSLDTNQRILYFCVSSLGGALLIFVSLIYMVLKGNSDK